MEAARLVLGMARRVTMAPDILQQIPVNIEDEMRSSYIDYAMSVIIGRALPDVRDGLKPVHRRCLFAMNDLGNHWNSAYKKSARIVGDVIGKYHPHGDSAVYDTIVRMAQDFSMRYLLVDGQGNFGSIDGDPAAAMRYTEVRMAKLSQELLADIDKETVDFGPNYDETLKEPLVLPTRIPNLLINGSEGIAVGMATKIPPHNLREILAATIELVHNPDATLADLMQHVQGPDFPTGGIILGRRGILDALSTGRGVLHVRAKTSIETLEGGKREAIIVHEIPYQVNKARMIEKIAELVREKKLEGITEIRDESDRTGIRVVIELRRDVNAEVLLNQLFKMTPMQSSFGVNTLAIVAGQPRVLSLKEALSHFIDHRRSVVTRRTQYELARAKERAHILEGLIIALDHIDEIIELIKRSSGPAEAKANLMDRFGLSDRQSQAILDMRLQRLTGLEQDKIRAEYAEVQALIARLEAILHDERLLLQVIVEELQAIVEAYGDERRTEIVDQEGDLDIEDLIPEETAVVLRTHTGYIKRVSLSEYRAQRRGGKGRKGMATKETDFVTDLFAASTHSPLLVFTNRGRAFGLKVYQIPAGGHSSRGKALVNLLPMEEGERVATVLPVPGFDAAGFLLFCTRKGRVKKTELSAYRNMRSSGLTATVLEEDDELMRVLFAQPGQTVLLATRRGMSIRFPEGQVRATGRVSRGVLGIRLRSGDALVDASLLPPAEEALPEEALVEGADENENGSAGEEPAAVLEDLAEPGDEESLGEEGEEEAVAEEVLASEAAVITITEKGFGKRTVLPEYRVQNRGGIGVIDIKITGKNGPVVGLTVVHPGDQIMLATDRGQIIRTPVDEVRAVGRNTQGVIVVRTEQGEKVVCLERLPEDALAGEEVADEAEPPAAAVSATGAAPDEEADAAPDEDLDAAPDAAPPGDQPDSQGGEG
jgi:DNA gyrase subunit A